MYPTSLDGNKVVNKNNGTLSGLSKALSRESVVDFCKNDDITTAFLQSLNIKSPKTSLNNIQSFDSLYKSKENVSSLNNSVNEHSVRTQYTQISDSATKSMQNLALEDTKNSFSTKGSSAVLGNQKHRESIINKELDKVSNSKRTATFNTMNKVWQNEIDRIGEHIKKKDSNWTNWGDKFDLSVLNDYKPCINVFI